MRSQRFALNCVFAFALIAQLHSPACAQANQPNVQKGNNHGYDNQGSEQLLDSLHINMEDRVRYELPEFPLKVVLDQRGCTLKPSETLQHFCWCYNCPSGSNIPLTTSKSKCGEGCAFLCTKAKYTVFFVGDDTSSTDKNRGKAVFVEFCANNPQCDLFPTTPEISKGENGTLIISKINQNLEYAEGYNPKQPFNRMHKYANDDLFQESGCAKVTVSHMYKWPEVEEPAEERPLDIGACNSDGSVPEDDTARTSGAPENPPGAGTASTPAASASSDSSTAPTTAAVPASP